jgi:cytochrome c2
VSASGDLTRGKQLFTEKCAYCHTLADAGATGKVGPNLDDAFGELRKESVGDFRDSTLRDIVADQIRYPGHRTPPLTSMPANLVTGSDVADVADYVASVAGKPVQSSQSTVAAAPPAAPTTSSSTGGAAGTTGGAAGKPSGGKAAAPPSAALVSQGKSLYASLGCQACHSITGAKGTGPTFKGLYGSSVKLTNSTVTANDAYLLESMRDPDKQIVSGFQPGIMTSVIKPGQVSVADAKALIAYIQSLK